MRGSLSQNFYSVREFRSIPAYAGEPDNNSIHYHIVKVDPRVCGGACKPHNPIGAHLGRSPRMRGSQFYKSKSCIEIGSIPAYAGEPRRVRRLDDIIKVDPRVCGGAKGTPVRDMSEKGRSPRMRGSPSSSSIFLLFGGSIPAYAGEPAEA